MRIAAMMVVAAVVGMAANDEELSDAKVTAAMVRAWQQSRNGLSRNEAGFRLDATRAGYEIVEVPPTNQFSAQRLPIIPGVTVALFHVHPSQADPAPSCERKNGDHIEMYRSGATGALRGFRAGQFGNSLIPILRQRQKPPGTQRSVPPCT